jgi:hypothetical protein
LAVECDPSCSAKKDANGKYRMQYEAFPVIAAIRQRSAADKAKLQVCDRIIRVSDRSILDEGVLEDAMLRNDIHLIVRRDGKDVNVVSVCLRAVRIRCRSPFG